MSTNPQGTNNWKYDHFLCLVLLYASYADYEFSKDERAHILSQVNVEVLADVEKLFNSLTDFQQLELILSLKKKYIKDDTDKSKLLTKLHELFDSDGDYSRLEATLYQFFERLL